MTDDRGVLPPNSTQKPPSKKGMVYSNIDMVVWWVVEDVVFAGRGPRLKRAAWFAV